MFPIEQDLRKLKSYIRNRSRPVGTIAEGYLVEECLVFCSSYMNDGVKTRFSRYGKNGDMVTTYNETSFIFPKLDHPIVGKRRNKGKSFTLDHESLVQAHRYTLFNCEDKLVEEYIK